MDNQREARILKSNQKWLNRDKKEPTKTQKNWLKEFKKRYCGKSPEKREP